MAENITITVDGRTVDVPSGTLIIEAARKLGIEIPTFCYDDRLRPVGACRMCLVEVEKMPKLIASCATPVAPNMIVHTDSEKVVKARKGVLEFLLINHPLDCPTCDKGGECPLQDNTYTYGPAESRYGENKIRFIEDSKNQKFDDIRLGPEIFLNRNRCIMCFKCVRIVRDLAGEADLGVFQRGSFANINVLEEIELDDEFSGNTVEYCPVGALTSKSFRYKIREWLLKKSPSVCNLCSDGCNMNIEWSRGEVFRHMARRNSGVDDGWLCDRGRYGFDLSRAQDRLVRPHIRRDNKLQACSWDEASALLSKHLQNIIDTNKGSEVAAVGSPILSNEEAFAIRRFFSDVVKSENVDFQTEYPKPIEPELLDLIGLDGSIKDLESDSTFVFIGCDPAVEHPVVSLRIRKAVSTYKAKAVFISSHDKKLGYFPITNIRIPFSAEAAAVNYLVSRISGKTTGDMADFKIDPDGLNRLADNLKNAGRIHIIAGREFFNHPDRAALLVGLIKLKKSTGAKLSILPPQGNFIGVSRFGLFPSLGHSFENMLERIESGEIKTMFVFGANPIDEYPDRKYIHDVLKNLEFLVVVSPFANATASLASVVLPQAMLPDYGGTFLNIEHRAQKFTPMTENPHSDVKPAWAILGELSSLLDMGNIWYSDSQVRKVMIDTIKEIEGLDNLPDNGVVIRFPAKDGYDPGDVSLAEPETPGIDYPYIMNWTPSAHHHGWITEKSDNLMRISGKQIAWMHPDDAAREEISDGQVLRIGTAETALNLPVIITTGVNKGEILIVNSFSANPVNRLLKKGRPTTFVSVRKS